MNRKLEDWQVDSLHARVDEHLARRGLSRDTAPLEDFRAVPHDGRSFVYGGEFVEATGRAQCRACGRRIARGDRALRFGHSFTEGGGYTATTVQVHAHDCRQGASTPA